MNPVEQRDFIIQNIHLMEGYELKDLVRKFRAKKLSADMGLYVSEHGSVSHLAQQFDLIEPDVSEQITRAVVAKFGSMAEMQTYEKFGQAIRFDRLRWNGEEFRIRTDYFRPIGVLGLIDYVVNNATKWGSYENPSEDKQTFEYSGVKVRWYKNGKITFRFPTRMQEERFLATVERWQKY